MSTTAIDERRIHPLNDAPLNPKGGYVLYWMQQAQRVHHNQALGLAIERANHLRMPLVVVFCLTPTYPEANWRHFTFMLQGLSEVEATLADMGIALHIEVGSPVEVASQAGRDAVLIVCDRGYLRHQRQWRSDLAGRAVCRVLEVECDAIVPVELVSRKAEFAARTVRPRIERHLPSFLVTPGPLDAPKQSAGKLFRRTGVAALSERLAANRRILPVTPLLEGGYSKALSILDNFLDKHLSKYEDRRHLLENDGGSHLSAYLHFGQISPLTVALAVRQAGAPEAAKSAFLEELVVRRELAINHVWFNPDYDRYEGLPEWARRTLAAHQNDKRQPKYDDDTLEKGQTHDPYWNGCMAEMRETGYMPNYMRMYWGKKVLQWAVSPEHAFATALRLNNTYFVDGRDANAYAGVGWIFGLHDRPWQERAIFGQVRYMARSGLERKFDMQRYLGNVAKKIAMVQHRQ